MTSCEQRVHLQMIRVIVPINAKLIDFFTKLL